MVETSAGVSFPIAFFDGESEANIGNAVVYPGMDFKVFQSVISQKIGISPHQFTVYLADPRGSRSSRRKIPITGKFNFSAISREKGCIFLVALKRSRRDRRRHPTSMAQQNRKDPPSNVMILKRNHDVNGIVNSHVFPNLGSGFGSPVEDFERRVRNLQIEKERYLTNMGLGNLSLVGREQEDFVVDRNLKSGLICEECMRGESGFHWCVYDAVTSGFRSSPAGPIARPGKKSA